jgi:hypothetical protein
MKADSDIADAVPISIKNKKLCKSAGYVNMSGVRQGKPG